MFYLVLLWLTCLFSLQDKWSRFLLYNNPSNSRILIGSRLWSIRGQAHRWRQRSIQVFWIFEFSIWTNHNSLLSIATNQFASFFIDIRSRHCLIFMSVKVAKFEIKRNFFGIFSFFYCMKQIDSMLPCVCSVIDHRGLQNVVKTSVIHSAAPRVPLLGLPHFDVICDLLLNRHTATWNLFVKWSKNWKFGG